MLPIIHQLVHTLSYGDAISNEVLALRRCLQTLPATSEIYAINTDPIYRELTRDYRCFEDDYRASLTKDHSGRQHSEVILHYSIGSPLNRLYRNLKNCRRSLIYHNITPAFWFRGVNPRIVRDIEQGLGELPELGRLSDRLIADSAFNARELNGYGLEAELLELPIDPMRWQITPNPGIAALLRSNPGAHLLHVGRLAPNKSIEDIIKIFYFLHHYIEPDSHLWLVGIDIDTGLYSFSLKRLVHELALTDAVHFVGRMEDSELAAFYQGSSVYLCMSEHEGFCLPVIEAMHFGLPVVAFEATALRETIGSGGVLVREKRHAELAELCAELINNSNLRAQLIEAGRRRASELSSDRFTEQTKRIWGGGPKSVGGSCGAAREISG